MCLYYFGFFNLTNDVIELDFEIYNILILKYLNFINIKTYQYQNEVLMFTYLLNYFFWNIFIFLMIFDYLYIYFYDLFKNLDFLLNDFLRRIFYKKKLPNKTLQKSFFKMMNIFIKKRNRNIYNSRSVLFKFIKIFSFMQYKKKYKKITHISSYFFKIFQRRLYLLIILKDLIFLTKNKNKMYLLNSGFKRRKRYLKKNKYFKFFKKNINKKNYIYNNMNQSFKKYNFKLKKNNKFKTNFSVNKSRQFNKTKFKHNSKYNKISSFKNVRFFSIKIGKYYKKKNFLNKNLNYIKKLIIYLEKI